MLYIKLLLVLIIGTATALAFPTAQISSLTTSLEARQDGGAICSKAAKDNYCGLGFQVNQGGPWWVSVWVYDTRCKVIGSAQAIYGELHNHAIYSQLKHTIVLSTFVQSKPNGDPLYAPYFNYAGQTFGNGGEDLDGFGTDRDYTSPNGLQTVEIKFYC